MTHDPKATPDAVTLAEQLDYPGDDLRPWTGKLPAKV